MLARRPVTVALPAARTPRGGLPYLVSKRALDVTLAVVLLPVVVPALVVLSVAISMTSPGWPLYRQLRVGREGRLFRIWKLRTMVRGADRAGPELTQAADPRVTRVGRLLRRWSLDEVPQVFNVLAGQMSFVGPRPELPTIVATYTAGQLDVLSVAPGLTGWSQIHGRDDLTIPAKLELDRAYVLARSLAMDCRILVRTIPLVLSGSGIKR